MHEGVEAVKRKMPIDSERISVTGASMGGAATWYHASHYPDFWSAAAPLYCGYCDYKLWEKPGGTTFHRQEWEEASWDRPRRGLSAGEPASYCVADHAR